MQLALWRAGTEREGTCFVPPPIDVEQFKPLIELSIREEFHIDKNENVVLYLGHLNPKRFPQILLSKFEDLSKRLCFKLLIFAPNFSYDRLYGAYFEQIDYEDGPKGQYRD